MPESGRLLAGQEGAIAAPAEAAQSTKHTSDLLRRFKEYATSVKEVTMKIPHPFQPHQADEIFDLVSTCCKHALTNLAAPVEFSCHMNGGIVCGPCYR